MTTLDAERLEALAAAVSEGTFEAAARTLHVTPSAISQRVKALEVALGRVLVTRTKPVRPTASGAAVLRAARQIQAITGDTLRELAAGSPSGPVAVSVAVNADSLATWLLPALTGAGDGLVFDLRRADEGQTAELLRDGAVMAAITTSPTPLPGCTVESLGRMRYRPRVAPSGAARWFADGPTVANLARAPMVCFDRDDPLQDRYLRRRARRRLDPPRHHVPGSGAFVRAVRAGLGWGMVPDLQVSGLAGADRRDPDLVELDPDGAVDVALHWQQWRVASPSLERVAAAVRRAAAVALD